MSDGTLGTLILNSVGQSAIPFNLTAATSSVGTYTYIVDLGRLDLNEERRRVWAYDQNLLGATLIGQQDTLVPISFTVIIKATSSDYRKEAYRILQRALLNKRGGTLQYKPEGAGGGVLDTYYHYVASPPPRLLDDASNRWDTDAGSDGFFTLQVDVELQTQPLATSDPDTPATVSSLTATLDNWKTGSLNNRITVSASDLEGSLPALIRLLITPASSQNLGRVILFRRSADDGTLANLNTVYEAEDASIIYPTVAWSQVADAARGEGDYMRCFPSEDANGEAQGLRFTIVNPGDAKGRFAVFGVGFDDEATTGVWTHQVKLSSGNLSQVGAADNFALNLQSWELIYVGEFELPLTDLSEASAGYDVGPYLEWFSTRASGTSEFRLDGIMLVWVSDLLGPDGEGTALDVVCDDVDIATSLAGIIAPEKLLVEKMLGTAGVIAERAYIVASDDDIKRVPETAPRGDFVELDPAIDHLLVLIQERASGYTILNDDFESYKGSRWMPVADMESDENWYSFLSEDGVALSTYYEVEGNQSVHIVDDHGKLDKSLDLEDDGRFDNGDFSCISIHATTIDASGWTWRFNNDGSPTYQRTDYSLSPGQRTFIYFKKSSFTPVFAPDWKTITSIAIQAAAAGWDLYADYWRIEKADPDNADVPNATGSVWDLQPNAGVWSIIEDISEDTPGATLACLDNEAAVEKSAQIAATTANDIRLRARVMAKRDRGNVGVWWRSSSILTTGSEDGYSAQVDSDGDALNIYRYTTGSPTLLDDPTLLATVDKWYTIGVLSRGSTHRVYAAMSSGLLYDDESIFEEGYLLSTVTDANHTTGKCGVVSIGTLGRFDDVVLQSIEDKVIPADQITVSGKAIFRTIAPFD